MSDLRSKALGYLRAGRVNVLYARTRAGDRQPAQIVAVVEGHHANYRVELNVGRWTCTCTSTEDCAHLAATQLVTNHPSAAARAQRSTAA